MPKYQVSSPEEAAKNLDADSRAETMFIFALIYLALPVFIILFSFFNTMYLVLSSIALVILIFFLAKQWRDANFHFFTLVKYWPLLLVSLTITYLSLAYPFVGKNEGDWLKHFAILNTLIRESWPPVIEFNEQTWFLRYYAAWYALPALFAKILGLQSLTVAMVIWTAAGLFIALVLAFHNVRKTWFLFVSALVFFFFSGLDIVRIFFQHHVEPVNPGWLSWWHGIGHVSSNLYSIAWVPQHITGICVATSLFIYNRRLALQYSGAIVVMTALWSPFGAVGLVPAVVWAVFKEGYKPAFSLQNWLITPLLGLSVLLYLTQGAEQVPFMFAWQHPHFSLTNFVLFCVIEFLLILGVLYWFEREERALIVILAMFLPLSILLHWGTLPELCMRGSIPAICIIAILVANSLLKSLKNGGWHREILVAYLIAGAFPVAVAFVKGLSMESADKKMTLEKFVIIFPEKYPGQWPNIASQYPYQYLVKTKDVAKAFGVPLLRGLPEKQKKREDTR